MDNEPPYLNPRDMPQDEIDVRFDWLAESTMRQDMRLYDRLASAATKVGKAVINYSLSHNPAIFLPRIFRSDQNWRD